MEVISAIALILVVCGVVRYTGGFGIFAFWAILIVCGIVVFQDFNWGSLSAWLALQTILGFALKENQKASNTE